MREVEETCPRAASSSCPSPQGCVSCRTAAQPRGDTRQVRAGRPGQRTAAELRCGARAEPGGPRGHGGPAAAPLGTAPTGHTAMGGTCHPQGARRGSSLLAGQHNSAPPRDNSPKFPQGRAAAPVPPARLGSARREGGRQGKGDSHATPARRRTDLPELQGGDDHEDEAAEAEAGPIPVRQAGIGLALQEL